MIIDLLLIRVKRVTKMSEKVATGILSGVVKVSGYFTSSVANSKVGKKFFGLLPGEIVLASLDGFGMLPVDLILILLWMKYTFANLLFSIFVEHMVVSFELLKGLNPRILFGLLTCQYGERHFTLIWPSFSCMQLVTSMEK